MRWLEGKGVPAPEPTVSKLNVPAPTSEDSEPSYADDQFSARGNAPKPASSSPTLLGKPLEQVGAASYATDQFSSRLPAGTKSLSPLSIGSLPRAPKSEESEIAELQELLSSGPRSARKDATPRAS